MKLMSLLVFFMTLGICCSSGERQNTNIPNNNLIDSFESAMPHGKPLPSGELSDDDRIKLAKASGKKAEYLPYDTLTYLVDQDSAGLLIFNFWNLDCQSCKKNIEVLEALRYKGEEIPNYQVIHINVDQLYPDMLNSFIREQALLAPIYTLNTDTIPNWTDAIENGWDGQVPAILIINNEEGIRLFYEKQFSAEEFQAILLPLLL